MIVSSLYFIILTLTAALFSFLFTAGLVKVLGATMLDVPNERSNHAVPVPKGGGMAVVGVMIAFLLVSSAPGMLAFALFLLAAVSVLDDRTSLSIRWRLMAQFAAVILGTLMIKEPVFQGLLPLPADKLLTMLLWMWIINLTNFMDGIDGITSSQTIALGVGVVVLFLVSQGALPRSLFIDGGIMAASIAGFAWWNKHPAKIFLGDVGSVPLGFMFGFLLFTLASHGQWAAALILPAYYVTDSSMTLLARMGRGANFWEAHSEHAYQRAVRAGVPHSAVTFELAIFNVVMIGLAVGSYFMPLFAWAFAVAAYVAAFMLMGRFATMRPARKAA